MFSNADISSALQQMELIKQSVEESNDQKLLMETMEDLSMVIGILACPIFRNIIRVQDSLAELNSQIAQHPSILPADFDIAVNGDLVLKVPQFDPDFCEEQRIPLADYMKNNKNDLVDEKPTDKVSS